MKGTNETEALRERVALLEDLLRREREHIAKLEARAEHTERLLSGGIQAATERPWADWYEKHRAVCPMRLRPLYE